MATPRVPLLLIAALLATVGCNPTSTYKPPPGVTATSHTFFPIDTGATHAIGAQTASDGVIACESCHPATSDSFKDFTCIGCHAHQQSVTDRLHLSVADYGYTSPKCLGCHATGAAVIFDHAGITDACAACHATGGAFQAFPASGHVAIGNSDCGGCHGTATWQGAKTVANDAFDPANNLTLTGQVPVFSGTVITTLQANAQSIPMRMNHATTTVSSTVLATCATCHPRAGQGFYAGGRLHDSLDSNTLPQPATCVDCHGTAAPVGFIGTLKADRTPPSAEMRHEAVLWDSGVPTRTAIVTQDCAACHVAPTAAMPGDWTTSKALVTAVAYHGSLTPAQQPTGCTDCHANSRPTGVITGATGLPAGVIFDHSSVLSDCAGCHASSFTSWGNGKFHLAASATPGTCANCHEGERPTSTTGWKSATYTTSPFDYGGQPDGGTNHGDGQDCAVCHGGPGTGSWGGTQNWVGGNYDHAPSTAAGTTCLTCHSTQRPDLVLGAGPANTAVNFDHSVNGTGDCFGCHQATVVAGQYTAYFNPTTHVLPGGDWKNGVGYPGAVLIAAPNEFVKVTQFTLQRDGGWITGLSSTQQTLNNAMLHTSAALPATLNAGPTGTPDYGKCWHCHTTNPDGGIATLSGGKLHASFTNYSGSFGGAVTGLPQPTACLDCHAQMRPKGIVEKGSTNILYPMDHAATFTAPANIGGNAHAGVGDMDCALCHKKPGNTWTDGVFHASIATAQPASCASCHYPLMVDAGVADVTATGYAMKHRSGLVTMQECSSCHFSALSNATKPVASNLWNPGAYHASISAQPSSCNDCHVNNGPTATKPSSIVYSMPKGGTATNGPQYANHQAPTFAGKDCGFCHGPDAKSVVTTWSTATPAHANLGPVTTCNGCHGLTNGLGSTVGTNNNLPVGLTDSTTVTTSSVVATGTLDQISHADVNVTAQQCGLCHTQQGPGTGTAAGKEWAIATFHKNFTAANPLVLNGTTGRCSNCHLNVRPGATFNPDHSGFTASSAKDCNACHSWPGTSATTPNWLGASGKPHGTTGSTAGDTYDCNSCHGQGGTANVHLSVPAANHYGGSFNGNTCTTCHIAYDSFGPTTATILYSHSGFSTTATTACGTCHAFSGGIYTTLTTTPTLSHPVTGQPHQFSQSTSVTGKYSDGSFTSAHTNATMTDCSACHKYTSTTASNNIWAFGHRGTMTSASRSTGKGHNGCAMCHEHQ